MVNAFVFLEDKMKYVHVPYPFEMQMKILFLLHRLWLKNDHHNTCDCKLECGDCLARIEWTIDRLRQIWKPEYYDFNLVINKVFNQDRTIINFDQITNLSFNEFELLLIE